MPRYRITRGSIHEKFHNSRKPVQIIGGGFGNGKTAAACVKAIRLATDYPGSNGLIARATYAKLNDTIRKELYKWIPSGQVARWPTTTDNTMILKNGSVINMRYIAQRGKKTDDGNTTSNLLSATYDWAVVDQIEDPEIVYKDYTDLIGRMRGSTPYKGDDPTMPMTGPRFVILTANPSANWVYHKLVKPMHNYLATGVVTDDLVYDEDTFEPLIDLFEGSTYENEANLPPDFIKGLEANYKGQMRKRFLMGEWAAYEGLVYPDFSIKTHMIPAEHITTILRNGFKDRTRFDGIQGFDLGIGKPSCYLCGFVDDHGRIFIIDGFYTPGLTHHQIAVKITEIQERYYNYIDFRDPIWADPQIFKRNQVVGETITTVGKALQEAGLYIKAGQNAIESGIMKLSGYLSIVDNLHYLDDTQPGPGIYFSEELSFIADEFLGYFWKTNDVGDRIDVPNGRNDHAMDTLKYLVSRMPDPTELIYKKPHLVPEIMKWQEAS